MELTNMTKEQIKKIRLTVQLMKLGVFLIICFLAPWYVTVLSVLLATKVTIEGEKE